MINQYLKKDEVEFIEIKMKRKGFTWDEINTRKKRIKEQIKKVITKEKKQKKRELTPEEINIKAKEIFARDLERLR